MAFYHGSLEELTLRTVLRPRGDGYVASADRELEELLECARPSDAIPRAEAVFLVRDPDDVDAAGGFVEFVYEVSPEGDVQESDLAWYSQAQCYLESGDMERAATCAAAYWSGMRHPGPESLIEARTRAALVIGPAPEPQRPS